MDVCIIGGGIGGLSAAVALKLLQMDYEVRVFERDQNFSNRKQVESLCYFIHNYGYRVMD